MSNYLITGGSGGIGYWTSIELCKRGHRVLAVSRNEKGLKELAERCEKEEGELRYLAGDLRDKVFIEEIDNYLGTHFVDIKGIVHNAGQLVSKSFEEYKEEEIEAMIGVNVLAPIRLMQHTLKYMRSGSHVLGIGSMGGFQGSKKFSGLSIYSSTKAALACLMECLSEEYKTKGVIFNCLALGAVETDMLKEAFPDYEAPLSAEQMGTYIAEFLIKGGQFINGKTIPVALQDPN